MADLSGKTLDGHYFLEQWLDAGGQGDVYRARDTRSGQIVAVKVLIESLDRGTRSRELFTREIDVAERLRHRNIVKVLEGRYDAQEQRYYVAMELLTGGSLRDRLSARPRVQPKEALALVRQIGNALHYAHGQGVVHRDIKPGNIMFRQNGEAVLADFGIAKILGATRTSVSTKMLGTAEYLSPEQCKGEPATHLSDVYALGVVMYQLLTGEIPFKSADGNPLVVLNKHIHEDPKPPRQLNPSIPLSLEQVVLIALSKNPQDRFQDAWALVNATEAAVERGEMPLMSKHDPNAPTQQVWPAGSRPSPTTKTVRVDPARDPAVRQWRWVVVVLGIIGLLSILLFMLAGLPTGRQGDGTQSSGGSTPTAGSITALGGTGSDPVTPTLPSQQPPIAPTEMPTIASTPVPTTPVPPTPTPTNTRTETPTSTPTSTPTATATASAIPSPTATIDVNTPPGTILEVGQTWRQGGLALTLDQAGAGLGAGALNQPGPGSLLGFAIRNDRTAAVVLNFSAANVSAVDNRGKKLEVAGINPFYGYWQSGGPGGDFVLAPGQTNRMYYEYSNLYVRFDVPNPAVTEVIVTVTNLSTIKDARWRIPNLEH